jgi:DtxR family Mn-dependent transcriptional regulator
VSDHDPDLLRYVGSLGLYPGVAVSVVAKAPFDGPVTVRVEEVDHVLGREVTDNIFVTETDTNS